MDYSIINVKWTGVGFEPNISHRHIISGYLNIEVHVKATPYWACTLWHNMTRSIFYTSIPCLVQWNCMEDIIQRFKVYIIHSNRGLGGNLSLCFWCDSQRDMVRISHGLSLSWILYVHLHQHNIFLTLTTVIHIHFWFCWGIKLGGLFRIQFLFSCLVLTKETFCSLVLDLFVVHPFYNWMYIIYTSCLPNKVH